MIRSQDRANFPGSLVKPLHVVFEASPNLAEILQQVRCSLLISTYQAGRLVGVGVANGALDLSFHSFARPMGLAVSRDWIALGAGSADLVPAQHAGDRADGRTGGQVRRLLHGPYLPCHVGDQLARAGLRRRAALARQHAVLLPLHVELEPQLPAPVEASLHLGHRPRGPLPPQRPGPGRRPAALCDGAGRNRHAPGLAARQGERRLPDRHRRQCHASHGGFSMPHSPRLHDGQLWLLDPAQDVS